MANVKVIKRAPSDKDAPAESRPYEPRGNCRELFRRRDGEILLSGGAGTGKSCAALNKLFYLCEQYPGIRCLVVRKTRESLSESTLVTWEEKVVPAGHACLDGAERSHRKEYVFPHATNVVKGKTYSGISRVVVAGLRQSHRDNTQKVMSTDYDFVYVPEGIELSIEEWEKLVMRLRNWKMPYQQLVADTNPSSPTHWLYKRCNSGKPGGVTVFLDTTHKDNPLFWDTKTNDWTPEGRDYIKNKLDPLAGVRRDRFRDGRWVQAEGIIYEGWRASSPWLIAPFELSKFWRRFRVIDFGFTNAFICQWYAIDDDGRLILYREYVKTKTLVEDHAKEIKELSAGDPVCEANVCDHDAEDRATLERHLGEGTVAAKKEVTVGIEALQSRLKVQEDGKPRFMVFDTALVAKDKLMEDEKKPIGFVEEVDGYVWDTSNTRETANLKEEPVKVNDHSCFPSGTLVATINGDVPIELIRAGDMVLTRSGYRKVLAAGQTGITNVLIAIKHETGVLRGTVNHPVFVQDRGWTPLDSVSYADKIVVCQEHDLSANLLFSTESNSVDIQSRSGARIARISGRTSTTANVVFSRFTKRFGNRLTVKFLKDVISTTLTKIRSIMRLKILNALRKPSIMPSIRSIQSDCPTCSLTLKKSDRLLSSGMEAIPACDGIANMARECSATDQKSRSNARIAVKTFRLETQIANEQSIVPMPAAHQPAESLVLTTKIVNANGAVVRSESTNTLKLNVALSSVLSVGVERLSEQITVHNLSVADHHEYFANGVLVHNCDCARYAAMYAYESVWVAPVDLNAQPNLMSPATDPAEAAINWRDEFDRAGKAIDWRSGSGNANWRGINDDLMNDI